MEFGNVLLFCILLPIIYTAIWIIVFGVGSDPSISIHCSADADNKVAGKEIESAFSKLDDVHAVFEKYDAEFTVVQYPVWRLLPLFSTWYMATILLISQLFTLKPDEYIVGKYGVFIANVLQANQIIVDFYNTTFGGYMIISSAIGILLAVLILAFQQIRSTM